MGKTKMTVGQAIVKFLNQQYIEMDGKVEPFVDGIFTIFGHGMVVGLGQALLDLLLPLFQGLGLFVQGVFLLVDPVLLPADLRPAPALRLLLPEGSRSGHGLSGGYPPRREIQIPPR